MQIALNAQLLNTSQSYRGAGVSVYCQQLLAQLGQIATAATADLQLTAFVNGPRRPLPGVIQQSSRWPLHQPLVRILWEQTVFPWSLQQQPPDWVHGLVNVLPLATAAPGIVTVHDLSFLRLPEKFRGAKRWYLSQLCRASVAKARHVIAVSRQTADDLQHFWQVDAQKISVIYNGVSEEFTPAPASAVAAFRQRRALPARFFLFLGTLEPRKNLPLLIRAFAQWRAQTTPENRAVALVIAGAKGWFYEQIFALVTELQLQEVVLFSGYVPVEELPDWYRAAELFLYPSLFEGFGLPVLEAMACGVPVICSDTGSLVEVAGESALIFPAQDEGALVHCLHQFTGDATLRADLRRAGLTRAQQFSWQRTAQQTVELYRTLL
ncbi:MAG: glycosyltransferase family 4 protein [Caldilineaceae bacterium]|nr:glycosyltransferase family 4 protein [Caldilineaceae bacterium]